MTVELDGNAMKTRYSRQLLEHAEDEEWARSLDPTQGAGTAETLSEALPVSLENMFDAARPLLRLISRGTVTNQRSESGSRVMVLRLLTTGKPETGDRTSVTIQDDVLTLWVDPDGIPQRATRVRKGTAGMLFVHVDTVRTESWTYATRGDHLVAMQTDDHSSVAGAGQHGEARTDLDGPGRRCRCGYCALGHCATVRSRSRQNATTGLLNSTTLYSGVFAVRQRCSGTMSTILQSRPSSPFSVLRIGSRERHTVPMSSMDEPRIVGCEPGGIVSGLRRRATPFLQGSSICGA